MAIIINGKTSNISVCNALDKVLILIFHIGKSLQLVTELQLLHVSVLGDASVADVTQVPCIENDLIWYESS
jgi:glutamate-5-semialdehyde dehydrogenase